MTRETVGRLLVGEDCQVTADEGFWFGLGVFETIALEKGVPLLLERHVQRMREGMAFLGINHSDDVLYGLVRQAVEHPGAQGRDCALKLAATKENLVAALRPNPYDANRLARGFSCVTSPLRRNETSSLLRFKTLNYGDCLLEKGRVNALGIDEPLFFNGKGHLCEGATTNVFALVEGRLMTPALGCGLLPGVMRRWVLEHSPFAIEEGFITRDMLLGAPEVFLTNSLMGIMPVTKLGSRPLARGKSTQRLMELWHEERACLCGSARP